MEWAGFIRPRTGTDDRVFGNTVMNLFLKCGACAAWSEWGNKFFGHLVS